MVRINSKYWNNILLHFEKITMEKPNLNYINQLARGEEEVKNTLINVIKDEFPLELESYLKIAEKQDFKELEDIVHRIKHKFSILGLEKSYENAVNFEFSLRANEINIDQKDSFELTLNSITNFLKTI